MTDLRKPVFDAVRAAAPAGLFSDAGNVLALDNLLDAFGVPRAHAAAPAKPSARRMATSRAGIDLIHSFEGLRLDAYKCPAGVWTIGWGATTDEQGKPIQPGTKWTRERADARFMQHLASFELAVNDALGTAPTTQGQFDALVSFTYNCGAANLRGSTLLKKHKAGDFGGAAVEFAKWNKAAGKALPGLTRRRAAEAALYRGQG